MRLLDNLNPREKRTVLICVVGGALLTLYFAVAEPMLKKAGQISTRMNLEREKIKMLTAEEPSPEALKVKKLITAVPVLDMPTSPDRQVQLLRDQLTRQIQRSGIQVRNFQFLSGSAQGPGDKGTLMLKCQGRCQFVSLLSLLEDLKNNPYYVGIEDLSIRADDRNRQDLEFILTVSTFGQSGA